MAEEERATAAITTKITPSEKTRFAALVQKHCINQSALIRTLIMEWVSRAETGQAPTVQILPAQSASTWSPGQFTLFQTNDTSDGAAKASEDDA